MAFALLLPGGVEVGEYIRSSEQEVLLITKYSLFSLFGQSLCLFGQVSFGFGQIVRVFRISQIKLSARYVLA